MTGVDYFFLGVGHGRLPNSKTPLHGNPFAWKKCILEIDNNSRREPTDRVQIILRFVNFYYLILKVERERERVLTIFVKKGSQ